MISHVARISRSTSTLPQQSLEHPSCLVSRRYAPYRLDTDARVSDSISLNQTASEYSVGWYASAHLGGAVLWASRCLHL